MVELKIYYDQASLNVAIGVSGKYPGHQDLILESIVGAMDTPKGDEFREYFADKPDTIETQIEMYAFLINDVCERISNGEKVGQEIATEKEISGLLEAIRENYALESAENVKTQEGKSLMVTYIHKEKENKTYAEIVNSYWELLGVKEMFEKKGHIKLQVVVHNMIESNGLRPFLNLQ